MKTISVEGDGGPLPTAPRAGNAHYRALDGVRGVAVLLVFIYHISGTADHFRMSRVGRVAVLGASCGWMGVDLFFVLSGFLITGILIDTVNYPRYFRNFYIRRILRIFPLFYGVFLLLAALTPFLQLQWQRGHLAYLFYCQNIALAFNHKLVDVTPAAYIGPFWSLAVEEQYYLLWPLLVWLIRDRRKIMRLCLALITFSILLRVILTRFLPNQIALYLIYWELPTHWDGLLLGSWLTLAMSRWPVKELWRKMRWLAVLAVAVLVGVGVYARTFDFRIPSMETVGFAAIPIVFSSLILRCFVPGSLECRIFSGRFLRFMGRYSYGIYVYQVLFWPLMILGLHWLGDHLHSRLAGDFVYLALWFSGTVAIAVLSYKILESPFLRMKERLAPSRHVFSRIAAEPKLY